LREDWEGVVFVMILTSHEVEEIRYLAINGHPEELERITISDVDLGAAVELACCRFIWRQSVPIVVRVFENWANSVPILRAAFRALVEGVVPSRQLKFEPQEIEFYPLVGTCWANNDHHLFASRFCKSVKGVGFGRTSQALAGAFHEMADNVAQHSASSGSMPARGLLGYRVAQQKMSFAVGDVGRGVLASLKENSQWQQISDSGAALEAILHQGASRRINAGPGEGFKQLFKSLGSLQGFLSFRSGDGFISLSGSRDAYIERRGSAIPFPGFQLSVTCSVEKQPPKNAT